VAAVLTAEDMVEVAAALRAVSRMAGYYASRSPRLLTPRCVSSIIRFKLRERLTGASA
jgi:hypothetical protein